MTQPSVSAFYGKRKAIRDDAVALNKKLKLDDNKIGLCLGKCVPVDVRASDSSTKEKQKDETKKKKKIIQADIRQSVKKLIKKSEVQTLDSSCVRELPNENLKEPTEANTNGDASVVKEPAANIKKCVVIEHRTPVKKQPEHSDVVSTSTEDLIRSANELVNKLKKTQSKLIQSNDGITKQKQNVLSLTDIKERLKQSSRLNELKKSIDKIKEHANDLIRVDNIKQNTLSPKIERFKSIDIEYVSPVKRSPCKSNSPVKIPAYQRYASLVEPPTAGTTAWTLPLSGRYQLLFELFEAVDQICSMIRQRGETITFRKLQPAVEEMTRKTLTERHLAQIASICPSLFTFRQEKMKNFGSTSKADRYELVVEPQVQRGELTPVAMKTRKTTLFRALLEKTKEYHKEFLSSLNPPVVIDDVDLKRWHPDFMMHSVPDIVPADLPQPPCAQGPVSAKNVLERARMFMSSSTRLLSALEAASQSPPTPATAPTAVTPSLQVKRAVDSRLGNPLKGVPSALLEKIRAKQAARALDAMKMTPQQEKEVLMYTRLPEYGRIVRTLFVDEKKSVLAWAQVVEKVQFSYNRSISRAEVDAHMKLLVEQTPEWLSTVSVRNTTFLKKSKTTDMSAIMDKLNALAAEKKKTLH